MSASPYAVFPSRNALQSIKATVGVYLQFSLPGLRYHTVLARVNLHLTEKNTLGDLFGAAYIS